LYFLRAGFFRQNPALGLAEPTPWRRELAGELDGAYWPQQAERLLRWALPEAVSTASSFRSECPFALKGSGRWHANDGGGRYRVLRNLVLEALRSLHSPRELDPEVELSSLLFIATGEIPWQPSIGRLISAIKTACFSEAITVGCKTLRWWSESRRVTYEDYEVFVGDAVPEELHMTVRGYWDRIQKALAPHGLCIVDEAEGIFLKFREEVTENGQS